MLKLLNKLSKISSSSSILQQHELKTFLRLIITTSTKSMNGSSSSSSSSQAIATQKELIEKGKRASAYLAIDENVTKVRRN